MGSNAQTIPTYKIYCQSSNLIAMNKFEVGSNFLSLGQLDKAAENFKLALYEDSLFCDAWDNLAVVMRRKGDYNKALTYYLKSYNINNRNDVACTNGAEILLLANKTELAFKWFSKAVEIDSANPEGYFGQAKCLVKIQEFDTALLALSKAKLLYIKQYKNEVHDANFLEGIIYFSKGDISKAILMLDQEYNFYSENPSMNYFLGFCYLDPAFENIELAKVYLLNAQKGGMTLDDKTLDRIGK